jgi:uncharacterized repeat protein (TIGR03803 family)
VAGEENNMSKLNWSMRACGILLLWATTAVTLHPQAKAVAPTVTFTTLHSFDGMDGQNPGAELVQGTDGNFYGTTLNGGANGYGSVFKITPSGTLTKLYSFCSQSNCPDGIGPNGLVQATDGDFYGTTGGGGANVYYGTVFKITSHGTFTTLYSFDGADGEFPYGELIQASNGKLYGMTGQGGAHNNGTVYSISTGGRLTTLHSFDGSPAGDGFFSTPGLVQADNGDFYGTTQGGGVNACPPYSGCGTVFRIIPRGKFTTLHSFDNTDGAEPVGAMIQGTDGKFYGTTEMGGAQHVGTVFKITSNGTLTTLYVFGLGGHGNWPTAGLIQATDGNFYGTTLEGGAKDACKPPKDCGTVFKIDKRGKLITLHSFHRKDGSYPLAALTESTDGNFYGTTTTGGANGNDCGSGCGTIFSLSVDLGPFVKTLPIAGNVGTVVKILGTNLSGATSVTFNGTAAPFTVVSSSEITTTVPAGATTGTVQVVTPGGALSSNVPFRVTQ